MKKNYYRLQGTRRNNGQTSMINRPVPQETTMPVDADEPTKQERVKVSAA
jgi:hypothetical protein